MEFYRKIRSAADKMSPSPGKQAAPSNVPNQGLATLLVMIAVLTIIILFCCFAAPGIRDICRKFCRCQIDNPRGDAASTAGNSTPTIILLPYGRMLVVDRNIFAQLQADQTGIDFMELSANLIRAQRFQTGSTPSIMDSEATSKGLSPISLGISPPTYEDIFGEKNSDLPPSYSELNLMFRRYSVQKSEESLEEVISNSVQRINVESDVVSVDDEVNCNANLDDRDSNQSDIDNAKNIRNTQGRSDLEAINESADDSRSNIEDYAQSDFCSKRT